MVRRQWQQLLVLGAYALLTVVMTWPVMGNLGSHIPGGEGDAWVHLWTFNWVKGAVLEGTSPFYTDLLFYPEGGSLVFHNIAWLHLMLWIPLQALVGAGAAYSLVFLANFVFNAFATYLLARDITARFLPAFVAGLIGGFWPYTMSHQSHPNLITVGWLALIILALRRALARRRVRDALLLALFIALCGITRWQLLIIIFPAVAIYTIYALSSEQRTVDRRTLGLLALAVVLAAVLMMPLAAPLLASQLSREHPEDLFVEPGPTSTDALAYAVPSRYHPLWGQAIYETSYQNFSRNKDFTPFVGYSALLLALLGVIWRRKSRIWLLILVAYFLLATGPNFTVNGREIMALPYAFIYDFFALRLVRFPDRFNVALGIPMAVLVALGIATLLRAKWLNSSWAQTATVIVLGGLILLEYMPAYPLLPLAVPDWYGQISQDDGEVIALLDLPMYRRSYDENYMLYQMEHGRPIVGGHISRAPREAFDFIESVPLLAAVREGERMPPYLPDVSHQLDRLAAAGVRYLILHQKYLNEEHESAWRQWLAFPPLFEDKDVIVYDTGPSQSRYELTSSFRSLSPDLPFGVVRSHMTPDFATPGSFVWIDLHWASSQPPEGSYRACVKLENGDNQVAARECQPLAPDWPTSRWEANELVFTRFVLQVDPFAQSDLYSATVTLLSTESLPLGTLALGEVAVESMARQFEPAQPPDVPVEAIWDETLALRGYSLEQTAELLDINLVWQAIQRPDQSYKLFLHLREARSGEIIAQADLVPRNWTYPTDWWEAEEYVDDTISLPLQNIAPGSYQLVLGWYDEQTQTRLPVRASTSAVATEFLLTTIDIPPVSSPASP